MAKLESVIDELEKQNGLSMHLDLRDPDALEIKLIDLAHVLSTCDEKFAAAFGRALKAQVPAWIGLIKAESERGDEEGPAATLLGLARAYSMLLHFLGASCVKRSTGRRGVDVMHKGLIEVITRDFQALANGWQGGSDATESRDKSSEA